jgi:hypothetical protein
MYPVKAKLSLCLVKHHTMKAYGGNGSIYPRILDLGTSSRWVPQLLYPWGKSPPGHWIGGYVRPTTGLDDVESRKSFTCRDPNSDLSAVQPVVSSYTDCNIQAHVCKSYPCNRPWRPIGLWDVEAPTFSLDMRLTDGANIVSLTRRLPFTPHEDSCYSFLLEAESTPGP